MARFDTAECRIVFEGDISVVYDAGSNTIVEATLTHHDLYIFDMRNAMPHHDLTGFHRELKHIPWCDDTNIAGYQNTSEHC